MLRFILSFVHSTGMCRMRQFLAVLRSFFHSCLLCTFSCHPSPPNSYILSHLILPSISWFTSQSSCSLKSFEMWCCRRMEKISWTDHVRNEEVLLRANEQRNILHEIRKWKANWIGHILHRNCLLQQVTEGKIKGQIEVTRI